jgi:hypothetical protein
VSAAAPQLLRIPHTFHTIEEVLGAAKQLDLQNIIVLSEREDGGLVFLTSESMTLSQCNWLLDRTKKLLLDP